MNEKRYPSRFVIIAAEDLRSEGGDKFSIMGVAPSGLPVIEQGGTFLIPCLAIYANFFDVDGEFDIRLIVENEGARIFDTPVPAAKISDNSEGNRARANFLVAGKFMNVKVEKPSKIKVTVKIDEKEYSQSFRLAVAVQE